LIYLNELFLNFIEIDKIMKYSCVTDKTPSRCSCF